MQLTKKLVVGEHAIYYFKGKDGTVIKKYDLDTDYNRRFLSEKQSPPLASEYDLPDDFIWDKANRATKFDTENGELGDGQYALMENNRILYNAHGRYDFIDKNVVMSLQTIPKEDLEK